MLGWGKALEVEAMTLAELKERLLELSPPQKRQLIRSPPWPLWLVS